MFLKQALCWFMMWGHTAGTLFGARLGGFGITAVKLFNSSFFMAIRAAMKPCLVPVTARETRRLSYLILQGFITFSCFFRVSRPLSPSWILLMTIESSNWQRSSTVYNPCVCAGLCVHVAVGGRHWEVSRVLLICDWACHGHLTLQQPRVRG